MRASESGVEREDSRCSIVVWDLHLFPSRRLDLARGACPERSGGPQTTRNRFASFIARWIWDYACRYGRGLRTRSCGGGAWQGAVDAGTSAVIATKVTPNRLAPGELAGAIEGSMKRLRTDYLDVYFIHWPNPDFPIGPTMEALEQLRAKGRIRAIGVSNFGPKEMDQSALARDHRRPAAALQHALARDRSGNPALLPQAQIGIMPYSGLAQGLLTGLLSRNTVFAEGDERRTTVLFQPGVYERALDAVDGLRPIAKNTASPSLSSPCNG